MIVFKERTLTIFLKFLLDAEVDVRGNRERREHRYLYTEATDLHKGIAALKQLELLNFQQQN